MRRFIGLILVALSALILYHLPLLNALTEPQKITALIFFVAAILWIFEIIPLYITSFVILVLEILWLLPKLENVKATAFLSPFFSTTIILFLGGFVLARGLEAYKIDELVAEKILEATKGKPGLTLFAFLAVSGFLSMWMSNTAVTALMLAVTLPVIKKLDDKNYAKALLIAIAFGANIGGMGTPIGTPPNAIALDYLKKAGISVNFPVWVGFAFPYVVILTVLTWLILYFMFPHRVKTVEMHVTPDQEKRKDPKVKVVIGVSILTALLWLTESIHRVDSAYIALLPVLIYFSFGILNRKDFNSLSWDVLILMGGGLSLGEAFKLSGLGTYVVNSLGLSNLPFSVQLAILAGITALITNFMSNTSTAALIIPLAMGLNLDPVHQAILVVSIGLSASASMLLPISTPPNAIVYSSGELRVVDMFKVGLAVLVIQYLVLITVERFLITLLVH
ncbi:MAG: SLC13 family permease [candidate division WOR-3 bacterium]